MSLFNRETKKVKKPKPKPLVKGPGKWAIYDAVDLHAYMHELPLDLYDVAIRVEPAPNDEQDEGGELSFFVFRLYEDFTRQNAVHYDAARFTKWAASTGALSYLIRTVTPADTGATPYCLITITDPAVRILEQFWAAKKRGPTVPKALYGDGA